ncbi:hypothetical protein [Demequina soli]|uniref:hypothetical protein n=1 Tax=Demequina soli TaxID=1638987 RepID=UPI000784AB86|nr:hypothetical protein [Demequina soli]
MVRRVAVVMIASCLLAGCAGGDETQAGYLASQGGIGAIPGARVEFHGTVTALANGCLMLARDNGTQPWIVWPPGTMPGSGGSADVDGVLFADGDAVTAIGTVAVLADLPGGGHDDTYYGLLGHYCDGDAAGVAVLDSIRHAAG